MDKETLSSYFWLNHEIQQQERRRDRLKRRINAGGLAADTVKGSAAEFPYLEKKIKITGSPTGLLKNIESDISKNIKAAIEAREGIEAFVNGIEDPQLRELLRSRFIDCLTWREVGRKNYLAPDYARRKVREYLLTLNKR